MRGLRAVSLAAALLAGACKVEPTPREYIDHRAPAAQERRAAQEEIQDRILAMAQALNAGNLEEATIALAPAPEAYVIAPGDSAAQQGVETISAALQRGAGGPVEIRDVQVEVGPRQNVAWFRAVLSPPGRVDAALRLTGVYVLQEGAWQLVQAHLSDPTPPAPPTPSPAEGADSAAAG